MGADLSKLAFSPVFGGLLDEELEAIAPFLRERVFRAGEAVVREGELGAEMYYIHRGSVVVVRTGRQGEEVLARLHEGDCFGEMSVIEVAPRSATVRALEDTITLSLSARDLQRLRRTHLKTFAMVVMNVARELSRRLRRADKTLCDFRDGLEPFEMEMTQPAVTVTGASPEKT
jgi:CRP/FNR family cyclic AMP-dependent transcriptional regulator